MKTKRPNVRNRDGLFGEDGGQQESSLPPHIRANLWQLFSQIEREVEIVYAENIARKSSRI